MLSAMHRSKSVWQAAAGRAAASRAAVVAARPGLAARSAAPDVEPAPQAESAEPQASTSGPEKVPLSDLPRWVRPIGRELAASHSVDLLGSSGRRRMASGGTGPHAGGALSGMLGRQHPQAQGPWLAMPSGDTYAVQCTTCNRELCASLPLFQPPVLLLIHHALSQSQPTPCYILSHCLTSFSSCYQWVCLLARRFTRCVRRTLLHCSALQAQPPCNEDPEQEHAEGG